MHPPITFGLLVSLLFGCCRGRPVKMLMQEIECALTINTVTALKKFDVHSVGQSKLRIKPANFGKFMSDPVIAANAIVMSTLDHEWARKNQVGHFCVIKGVTEIPVGHFPFRGPHERERLVG